MTTTPGKDATKKQIEGVQHQSEGFKKVTDSIQMQIVHAIKEPPAARSLKQMQTLEGFQTCLENMRWAGFFASPYRRRFGLHEAEHTRARLELLNVHHLHAEKREPQQLRLRVDAATVGSVVLTEKTKQKRSYKVTVMRMAMTCM
jgi:hypothetical protein